MIARLADNGKQVSLRLREKLEVRLPESQVSGYLWELKGDHPCLLLEDSDYVEEGPARFNGLGERQWRLRASATGTCTLGFFLVRPWSAPALEYTLTVTVT
jgi:predicted secreted protein